MGYWDTWLRQPQTIGVRKVLFQVHLWSGIGLGLYIVAICLSGSVLVYRNELYGVFAPTVENPMPLGFRATGWLLDFHDNLLSGETGRRTNGVLAALVIVLSVTGIIIWWPGTHRWRRSLLIDRRANWKQLNWSVHSSLGIWFAAFVLMWGVTGLYLSYPQPFNAAIDYVEPYDELNPVERTGDRVLYWLAYSHFGRFGGRIPGCVRGGTCDAVLKAVWSAAGVVPVVMFVTGAIMWWNRPRPEKRKRITALRSREPA